MKVISQHIDHIEDMVWLPLEYIQILSNLTLMDFCNIELREKIDGAPAIVVGWDKAGWFVCRKHEVHKKHYYTVKQIAESTMTDVVQNVYSNVLMKLPMYDPECGEFVAHGDVLLPCDEVGLYKSNVVEYKITPAKRYDSVIALHTVIANSTAIEEVFDELNQSGRILYVNNKLDIDWDSEEWLMLLSIFDVGMQAALVGQTAIEPILEKHQVDHAHYREIVKYAMNQHLKANGRMQSSTFDIRSLMPYIGAKATDRNKYGRVMRVLQDGDGSKVTAMLLLAAKLIHDMKQQITLPYLTGVIESINGSEGHVIEFLGHGLVAKVIDRNTFSINNFRKHGEAA